MTDTQPQRRTDAAALPVTFEDVVDAARRLDGVARRTPVLTSRLLDELTESRVVLKCENFQRTGAFKFRGAYNALSRLDPGGYEGGVLTYSSGNHAQALALAGRLLGIRTVVIMPDDAPAIKRRATEGYGAELISYDRATTTREELARSVSSERGLPIIPPYDHPDIVAGQGTAALELLTERPDLDVLLVCCGGGGLLSGSAISARHLRPTCRVIGVEPAAADDATRSFRTGTLQRVHNPDTVADGARTPYLGTITFPLVMHLVDDMVTVEERAIVEAMRFLWERMKIVVEPTGALALSALLGGAVAFPGKNVGIIVSGGNVDIAHAARLFAELDA